MIKPGGREVCQLVFDVPPELVQDQKPLDWAVPVWLELREKDAPDGLVARFCVNYFRPLKHLYPDEGAPHFDRDYWDRELPTQ